MVDIKFLLISTLLISINITNAEFNLNIISNTDGNVSITYSGIEVDVITESDVRLFGIGTQRLEEAVNQYYGRKPKNVYLRSPTPWGDLYKKYKWEQVSRVLSIKSARVVRADKKSIIVASQDFDNVSNKTIKVNTGINHSVENTVTSSWTESSETEVSLGLEVKSSFVTSSITYSNSFGYGRSEEKSESVTIGTSTGVEIELQPGQSVTASLSANAGSLEIEVVYTAKLRGNLALNFKKIYNGHHFWGPSIENVMKSGGITNEKTNVQRIKFGYYSDASLKVFDRVSGKVL